jgi:hypothetical protein
MALIKPCRDANPSYTVLKSDNPENWLRKSDVLGPKNATQRNACQDCAQKKLDVKEEWATGAL